MRIAVYPGSFDPITMGHIDIINENQTLIDGIVNRKHIPFHSFKGTDGKGFGALDTDRKMLLDTISRYGINRQQRYQQKD